MVSLPNERMARNTGSPDRLEPCLTNSRYLVLFILGSKVA
jgi:hypothetical protein